MCLDAVRPRLLGTPGSFSILLNGLLNIIPSHCLAGEPVQRLVKDKIIWAPAIDGAFVLTTRGGDFELHIGQDVSIGYSNHTDTTVRLYLQETFTFLLLTTEAAVAMAAPAER